MDATESDPRVGGVIAARYRVESVLGEGGMGVVYLTEHVHMKKRFAVKVLHRELTHDDEVVQRFEREAVAAGRIEHENVVAAKDFGRLEDGSFYLVLEHIVGPTLRSVVEAGRVEPRRALGIARQIAAALGAAHSAGIVHRDLKPDNVMLVEGAKGKELVKVLDFGIAKLTQGAHGAAPLTRVGSVFGTPEYMSPELALGEGVDHRADLYALGIVLYEMLAGRLPFESSERVAVITQQLAAEPPPLPADVDAGVASLVLGLMAKAPDARPQSAAEVTARIDALLASDKAAAGFERAQTMLAAQMPALPDAPLAVSAPASPSPPAVAPAPVDVGAVLAPVVRLLKGHLNVKGKQVPVWAVAAVALFLTVVLASLSAGLLGRIGAKSKAATPEGKPQSALAARASKGDAAAVAELEKRPQDELDVEELCALGAGRMRLGRSRAALQAYQTAIERDAQVTKRADVVRDLRRAADDPATARDALELAAQSFGAAGADVLFDVREHAQPGSSVANRAGELLDSAKVREAASESLRIALDLSRATLSKKCPEVKELMPRASQHADKRSLPYLEKVMKKRGCGRRGRHDCYRCLRTGTELADAMQRASTTEAPKLDAPLPAADSP